MLRHYLDPLHPSYLATKGVVVTGTELHFTKALPESVARDIHDAFLDRLARRDAQRRRPPGIGPQVTDILGSALDPVFLLAAAGFGFVAYSFIPRQRRPSEASTQSQTS